MPSNPYYIHLRPPMPAWRDEAACRGVDPTLFFPDVGEPAHEARAVCASCPVRDECAEWAIRSGEKFGIWGGLTERERRRIRSQRHRAARLSA